MGLSGENRRDICLLGAAPEQLKAAISNRDLAWLETSSEAAVARCRGPARAVISISNPAELSKQLASLLRPVLENGAAFVAVNTESNRFAQIPEMLGPKSI